MFTTEITEDTENGGKDADGKGAVMVVHVCLAFLCALRVLCGEMGREGGME